MRGCAVVYNDGNRAVRKLGIRPIALLHDLRHTEIVPCNTVIPVFLQICGKRFGREIHVGRLCAKEGKFAYVFNAIRKCDAFQRGTVIECVSAKIRHTLGNCKGGQTLTEAEGKVVNIGELRITKVNGIQISHALKSVRLNGGQRTSLFKADLHEVGTAAEHISRDGRQLTAACKSDQSQLGAALERPLRNRRYACGNTQIGNAAVSKRLIADAGQLAVLVKADLTELGRICECQVGDLHDVCGNMHGIQHRTIVKCLTANLAQSRGQFNRAKVLRSEEGCLTNDGYGLRYRVRGRGSTCGICYKHSHALIIDNAVYVTIHGVLIRNVNACKAAAGGKYTLLQHRNACGQRNCRQSRFTECISTDLFKILGQLDLRQILCAVESIITDHAQLTSLFKNDRVQFR